MLEITARTTVAELAAAPPAVMQALRATGIYRDGDDPGLMLGQLCWSFGLNPGILVTMLQAANAPVAPPPVDIQPFLEMPLADFVTHIEEVHHAGLRDQLPRLRALVGEAVTRAPGDERLVRLRQEAERLADELESHLAHEEEALFPMIRGLANGTVVATRCGSSVNGPIACMENDHDSAERSLQRLRELTDNYTRPAAGRPLLDLLAEFDEDLRIHMYKENEALFPRASAIRPRQRA